MVSTKNISLDRNPFIERHAGHSTCRDDGEQWRCAAYSRNMPLIRRMSRVPHLVVDDAGCHEQRCLEDRVIDDVEDGRRRPPCWRVRGPASSVIEAEMADGRVCKKPLEVMSFRSATYAPYTKVIAPVAADKDEPQSQCRKVLDRSGRRRNTPAFTIVAE
jgi:hypothetical protein